MRLRKAASTAIVSIAGISVLALAACGGGGTSTGLQKLPDNQQVVRFPIDNASGNDIKTYDPALVSDFYSSEVLNLVFPSLYYIDHNMTLQPEAAAAMPTFSSDGLTMSVKLRSDLKWSDGSPITAQDFAYGINRSLDPCTGSAAATFFLGAIKDSLAYAGEKCTSTAANPTTSPNLIDKGDITVVDPTDLTFKLAAPTSYFAYTLTSNNAQAQPKSLISQYGLKDWTSHLTDNGGFSGYLFKVASDTKTGSIKLARNDSTWATKPQLKEIDITIYKDPNTENSAYLNGQLDTGGIPAAQYPTQKSRSDIHTSPTMDIGYLQPNWAKAPFDNKLARQAFALAINKDALATNIDKGTVDPTNHIIPSGMPGYNTGLTGPDGTTSTAGNAAQAKTLITQYAQQACGGDISKCPPVTFLNTNTPTDQLTSQALLQMWNTAMPGYPVTLQNTDFNTMLDDFYSGKYQLLAIGYSVDWPYPDDFTSLQFGPGNAGNVNDAAANTLMSKADATTDPTTAEGLYNQAEQILVNDVAWIPLDQAKNIWLQKTSFHTAYPLHGGMGYPTNDVWDTAYMQG